MFNIAMYLSLALLASYIEAAMVMVVVTILVAWRIIAARKRRGTASSSPILLEARVIASGRQHDWHLVMLVPP